MATYKIVRMHLRDSEHPRTLEEARAYGKDANTGWRGAK